MADSIIIDTEGALGNIILPALDLGNKFNPGTPILITNPKEKVIILPEGNDPISTDPVYVDLSTGVTGILPIGNGGSGSGTQVWVDLTTAQDVYGKKTFVNETSFPTAAKFNNTILYSPDTPGDVFNVRRYAEDYTILNVWSPPQTSSGGAKKSIISVSRGDASEYSIDLYNTDEGLADEGNHMDYGLPEMGLIFQKRGDGVYTPVYFEYGDGENEFKAITILPNGTNTENKTSVEVNRLIANYDGDTKLLTTIEGIDVTGNGVFSGIVYADGGNSTEWNKASIAILYTNLTPMPEKVGGNLAGTTFEDKTTNEMFDSLLYPYQYPTFSSFSIDSQAILECGVEIIAGSHIFNWDTTNDGNITENSVSVTDVTNATVIGSDLLNDGEEILVLPLSITKTITTQTHTWSIEAANTKSEAFSRTSTVKWLSPFYYGSGDPGLTVSQVQGLTKKVVSKSTSMTYAFSPSTQVFYFAYPASYGDLSSILDTSGFETIGDWTKRYESFTKNSPLYEGTTIAYNIYEFNNLTSQTSFNNTFKF